MKNLNQNVYCPPVFFHAGSANGRLCYNDVMSNIFKAFFSFIRNHKIWSIIIGLIVIGVIWFVFFGGPKDSIPTFVLAETGLLRQEVSVTGNVKPFSEVDLAFERGGRVAVLNVAVGDKVYIRQLLASISNADLMANLDQAKANLKKVQASFGDSALKTDLDFSQAENSLVNTIRDSYTKADDAVRNKIYSLFTDPARYRAKLSFSTDTFLQEDIEEGKDDLTDLLDSWSRSLVSLNNASNLDAYYSTTSNNLISIKKILDKCAEAVNGLGPDSSSVTQTQIDAWKLNISTARTSINTVIDTLTASFDSYKTASLSVKTSKNSNLAEEASIEQAKAQVASAEAELTKSNITSPISGIITKVDMKLGEIVSANKNVVSVISYGDYEVESFISEADISKIKLNDKARATLDAYGDSATFDMAVIKIDPAATVIDGVPTYKVTLKFTNQDDRIRSGMTANLDILTAEREGVLLVPARAIFGKDGLKYVKILGTDNIIQEVKVDLGLRGSDGNVEIVSGLNVGDQVVTSL